ncbi:MAG: CDP-diacylglycerol--glycerol-3-phosphate 3-phosphatidyltransferase [Alphaproteobacteria bacterium]|nr:MAG: CDP-diacylglycerol--glycerol-3-phosphate 3-phosphatidyltransferase [Alphaproteobacteria bacterium]
MITTLPNLLTLSRIVIIPLFMAVFYLDSPLSNWLAVVLFCIAGITDFFDGYFARRNGQMSKLGEFLDPVADKLLVVAALFMLVAFDRIDQISLIAAIIIMCREVLVSGLREFLAEVRVSLPVTQLAKWKTVMQLVAIGFLLAGDAGAAVYAVEIGTAFLWIAALLTIYTGYDYLNAGLRHITELREDDQ